MVKFLMDWQFFIATPKKLEKKFKNEPYCIVISQSFDLHQFILSDIVDGDAMCYSTLGFAN